MPRLTPTVARPIFGSPAYAPSERPAYRGGGGAASVAHPLAYLFASRDGFLYDGFYSSGGVDFGLDSEGATACEAAGDVCLFVRDHSGLGHHLKQPTSGNGLIYRVDGGGHKSFVTGNLTNGGAQRYAQVEGVGALPDEYVDVIVFRAFSYYGIGQYENFFESCSMSGVGDFYGGATDRTVLYGTTYRGAGLVYGGWAMQYNDTALSRSFNGGGAKIFPYRDYPGVLCLEVKSASILGAARELPETLTELNSLSWSGTGAAPNGGARTLIGGDNSGNLVNMERVFRMRVYGSLAAEDFADIVSYLNSSGISAWTGGAG